MLSGRDASAILVVDDDAASAYLAQRVLREAGFTVDVVATGPEALSAAQGHAYGLLLVDVVLPGFDGLELCRQLRDEAGYASLPLVLITGVDADELESRAFAAGATDVMRKPVQRDGLVARVRSLLAVSGAARERELLLQLSQSEKLAAIGQIAAGVAHEINNPLSFMLSNVEEAARVFADMQAVLAAYRRSPAEGQAAEARPGFQEAVADLDALFAETRSGGDRVRAIVRQLKVYTRMNGGALEPVDLAEVARGTLLLTGRELAQRAQVETDLQPAPIAAAPSADLHQVALNLVVNAMQALDGGDPKTQRLLLRSGLEGDHAVLRVRDSGPGIPPEVRRHIFEPFFTTKPLGVGTGLGLSFSAEVARRLGGSLTFDSEPGRTEFCLRVPCAAAPAAGGTVGGSEG